MSNPFTPRGATTVADPSVNQPCWYWLGQARYPAKVRDVLSPERVSVWVDWINTPADVQVVPNVPWTTDTGEQERAQAAEPNDAPDMTNIDEHIRHPHQLNQPDNE